MDAEPYVIDRYVIDSLMRDLVWHDRRPSAYLVYLTLWVASGGSRALMSLAQLAEQTGLSKRGVQDALRHLDSFHLQRDVFDSPLALHRAAVRFLPS